MERERERERDGESERRSVGWGGGLLRAPIVCQAPVSSVSPTDGPPAPVRKRAPHCDVSAIL